MPGGAEVGEGGGARDRGEQDVGGLDVAVDDAGGVQVGEGGEEVGEDGEGLRLAEGRAGREDVREGQGEVGEEEDEAAVLVAEGGVQGDDVGVVEGLQDAGFTRSVVRLREVCLGDHFEGDGARGGGVAVDARDEAGGDEVAVAVGADCCAGR